MNSRNQRSAGDLVPAPRADYTTSEEIIGDHLFLYDQNQDLVYQLNDGAAVVWLLCDGQRDLHSIADEIGDTYGIPREQALADALVAVEQFQQLGLLDPVQSVPSGHPAG